MSFVCVLCAVSAGGPDIVLTTHSGRPVLIHLSGVLVHSLLSYRHLGCMSRSVSPTLGECKLQRKNERKEKCEPIQRKDNKKLPILTDGEGDIRYLKVKKPKSGPSKLIYIEGH